MRVKLIKDSALSFLVYFLDGQPVVYRSDLKEDPFDPWEQKIVYISAQGTGGDGCIHMYYRDISADFSRGDQLLMIIESSRILTFDRSHIVIDLEGKTLLDSLDYSQEKIFEFAPIVYQELSFLEKLKKVTPMVDVDLSFIDPSLVTTKYFVHMSDAKIYAEQNNLLVRA